MLFLLIHDFVHAKNRGLCFVSCDCVGDATWRIRLQVTTIEAERHRTTLFEHDRPIDNKGGGYGSVVVGAGQRTGRSLSVLLSESGAVAGRGLLLDENAWDQISSMDRLAERISHGYFSALIDVDGPQYLCGLKISRKFLKMPRDMCAASPSAFKGGFGAPTDTNQLSSTPGSSSAAAPGALLLGNVRHEWVFLVQRHPQGGGGSQGTSGAGPDADYFSDIRDKMRSMNVPHSMLTLAELRASGCRHSAVVVHETYLAKLYREGNTTTAAVAGDIAVPTGTDLCAYAVDLVVVWDTNASQTVHALKSDYGVRVTAGLTSKATMLEVFGQVKVRLMGAAACCCL